MDITAALSSAKTAFELARALHTGLARQQIKPEEVPARLMELQQHILSMQAVVHDLAEENRQLQRKLDDQDEHRKLDADMDFVIDGGFYVRKSEVQKGLIAYCPVCWKKDGKTIPLETSMTSGWFHCSVHNTVYKTAKRRQEEEAAARRADMPDYHGPDSWMRR
jgi:hypothetical protein